MPVHSVMQVFILGTVVHRWLEFRMKELEGQLEHYTMDMTEEEEASTVRYRCDRRCLDVVHEYANGQVDDGHSDHDSRSEDSCEEESYPGRVYLNLGVLAEETTKLIALLTSRLRVWPPLDGLPLEMTYATCPLFFEVAVWQLT